VTKSMTLALSLYFISRDSGRAIDRNGEIRLFLSTSKDRQKH